MIVRVLLAVQPFSAAKRLIRLLRDAGVEPVSVGRAEDLWNRLIRGDFDVVCLGGTLLPEPPSDLVASIRGLPEHPDVIVFRTHEDAEERAKLLAAGAMAVLWQGLSDQVLGDTFRALLNRRREVAISRLKADRPEERYSLNDFIYASPAMQRFLDIARRVVSTDSALLILGETGVGKERLARAIHAESPRSAGPFMALNCGALPETLLESELFGHEEGAFTGASRARRGYFEMAHKGTIFLDEIGDVPLHVQVKLLRVLEDRRLLRVGSERAVQIDARVMAATNRNLEAELKAKRFRPDLYYRLAVVTLTVPTLRERREDIPLLARSYLEYYGISLRRAVTGISSRAMEAMMAYAWPGNVRELINVMERAVLLCPSEEIDVSDLPPTIAGRVASLGEDAGELPLELASGFRRETLGKPLRTARADVLASFERAYLSRLLRVTRGSISETAARAGINERSLYDLMKRHDLRKEAFKPVNRKPTPES